MMRSFAAEGFAAAAPQTSPARTGSDPWSWFNSLTKHAEDEKIARRSSEPSPPLAILVGTIGFVEPVPPAAGVPAEVRASFVAEAGLETEAAEAGVPSEVRGSFVAEAGLPTEAPEAGVPIEAVVGLQSEVRESFVAEAGLPTGFVAELDLAAEEDEENEEDEAGAWDPQRLPDITTLASPFTNLLDGALMVLSPRALMALSPRALTQAMSPRALSPTTPRERALSPTTPSQRALSPTTPSQRALSPTVPREPPSPGAASTPRPVQHLVPPPAGATPRLVPPSPAVELATPRSIQYLVPPPAARGGAPGRDKSESS